MYTIFHYHNLNVLNTHNSKFFLKMPRIQYQFYIYRKGNISTLTFRVCVYNELCYLGNSKYYVYIYENKNDFFNGLVTCSTISR